MATCGIVGAANFSSPTSGVDFYQTGLWEQLANAYIERRIWSDLDYPWDSSYYYTKRDICFHNGALYIATENTDPGDEPGVSGKWFQYYLLVAGDDIQRADEGPNAPDDMDFSGLTRGNLWVSIRDMQRFVTNSYNAFVPEQTFSNFSYQTYANFEDFCTNAGMHASGFRSAETYDPNAGDDWTAGEGANMWVANNDYAIATNGYIIGGWIVDDLQKAFTAMGYRIVASDISPGDRVWMSATNQTERFSLGTGTTADDAVTDCNDNWYTETSNGVAPLILFRRGITQNTSSDFDAGQRRDQARYNLGSIKVPDSTDYDWDLISYFTFEGTNYASHGYGAYATNAWNSFDSGAGSSADSFTTAYIGDVSAGKPFESTPAYDVPTVNDQTVIQMFVFAFPRIVFKPNYTYSGQ